MPGDDILISCVTTCETGTAPGGGTQLLGGPGADELVGGFRDDLLEGGPGEDTCEGGPGTDTATGCEIARDIP